MPRNHLALPTRYARRGLLALPLAGALVAGCGRARALTARANEQGDGLEAEYWDNAEWSGEPRIRRVDPLLDFTWSRSPIDGGRPVLFSIRWRGFLRIPNDEPGYYVLTLLSDDGSWLDLDGTTIIDNGGIHYPEARSKRLALTIGWHQIEIRYFAGPDPPAMLRFSWETPSGRREVVPQAALYTRRPKY